jgi:Bifunctional DNA primase/polymerase, N-terminal
MQTNNVLRCALELGLPCFPCNTEDKSPLTRNGFKDASAEPAIVRAMFAPHKDCLIGVPCGEIAGFDALDVDPRNGGGQWYEQNKPNLPETRVHNTRSGGLHIFFKWLPGLGPSSGKIAPGIDIRANGSYVIWWAAHGYGFKDWPSTGAPA